MGMCRGKLQMWTKLHQMFTVVTLFPTSHLTRCSKKIDISLFFFFYNLNPMSNISTY